MTTEAVPLRHILAPGSYGIQWFLPSDQGVTTTVHGDIDLQPSTPPRGEMAFEGIPIEWETNGALKSAGFPQTYTYPILKGKLRSNHDVVLIEAVVTTWAPNQAMVEARCALVGLGAPSVEDQFDSMRIQTSFLDRLSGVAPIAMTSIPMPEQDKPLKWWAQQAESLQQVWTSEKRSSPWASTAALGQVIPTNLLYVTARSRPLASALQRNLMKSSGNG